MIIFAIILFVCLTAIGQVALRMEAGPKKDPRVFVPAHSKQMARHIQEQEAARERLRNSRPS